MANEQMDNFEDLEELQTNELDDIVLDKYEKKDTIKRYLLIGGSLFLIFLIVLGIVKIVSDSSSAPQDSLIEMQEAVSSSEEVTPPEESSDMEEVPIVEEDNLKEQEEEISQVIHDVIKKEQNIPAAKATIETPHHLPVATTTPKKKESKPTATKQKSVAAKPHPKATPKQHRKPKRAKVVASKSQPKTTPQPQSKPKRAKVNAKGSYYIQVGAFLKYDPDRSFLQKIKQAGFSYIIKEFHINGKRVKRVYVGPFSSRQEAKRYLAKVQAKINKNAFVTKVE